MARYRQIVGVPAIRMLKFAAVLSAWKSRFVSRCTLREANRKKKAATSSKSRSVTSKCDSVYGRWNIGDSWPRLHAFAPLYIKLNLFIYSGFAHDYEHVRRNEEKPRRSTFIFSAAFPAWESFASSSFFHLLSFSLSCFVLFNLRTTVCLSSLRCRGSSRFRDYDLEMIESCRIKTKVF